MRQILFSCLFIISSIFTTSSFAAGENKINLRLFGKSVHKGYTGCSFAFWQRDRDPHQDKFAYVFYVRFHDGQPRPALVKIGKKLLELDKVEMGVKESGLADKFQLYRDYDKTTTLLVEIKDEKRKGDNTYINKARLTFIQTGKVPFVITVRGGFYCPPNNNDDQSAAPVEEQAPKKVREVKKTKKAKPRALAMPRNLDSNGIKLGRVVSFNSLKQVPRAVRKVVRGNGEACNLDNVPGVSEKYAISDAMTLWLVPCDIFASSASFMLVTALNGTKHAIGLEVPSRPGKSGGAPSYDMLDPQINSAKGIVSVLYMGRHGDCGTLKQYQLVFAEGESIELKLLQVREKNDCNGVKVHPNDLPVVYRAK